MSTPIIVWSLIAGFFAIVLLISLIHAAVGHCHHFMRLGHEREEFYIPGDPLKEEDNDYEE